MARADSFYAADTIWKNLLPHRFDVSECLARPIRVYVINRPNLIDAYHLNR